MEPLEEEAEAVRVLRREQAAEEAATPGRVPAPLPAPCPMLAPPAPARGRAEGRGVPGDWLWPLHPGRRPFAKPLFWVKPSGQQAESRVGGPGGSKRDSGTCTPF